MVVRQSIRSTKLLRLDSTILVSATSYSLSLLFFRGSRIVTHDSHADTAQSYRNELEVGIALQESGLKREDVYITTKYSGLNGLDIETSIQNSLKNVRKFVGSIEYNVLNLHISLVLNMWTYI